MDMCVCNEVVKQDIAIDCLSPSPSFGPHTSSVAFESSLISLYLLSFRVELVIVLTSWDCYEDYL